MNRLNHVTKFNDQIEYSSLNWTEMQFSRQSEWIIWTYSLSRDDP